MGNEGHQSLRVRVIVKVAIASDTSRAGDTLDMIASRTTAAQIDTM